MRKRNFTKSSKRICTILLVTLATVLALCCTVYASEDRIKSIDLEIKNQEAEYNRLQRQIKDTNRKISDTKAKEKEVTSQLETLSQKITLTQKRVNVLNLKVVRVQNNIQKLNISIASKEKEIEKIKVLLGARLVSMYKYGGVTEFNLLFSSAGAQDALNTSYLLGRIAKEDQRLISELEKEIDELNAMKQSLAKEQTVYEGHRTELNERGVELKSAANERKIALKKVQKEKAEYLAQQKDFQKASQELQNKITQLIAQKRRINAAKNKKEQQVVYYRKGGRLMWPTQGRISSRFGTRSHPVFKTKTTHTGLDIAAPKGTPVCAANAGEVLYTGWMRGYGQVIILDHGGDLTTVYAHLSQITCKEDQSVRRGQQIGMVGSTGVATGNHLHFEVRVNGKAVDPMGYLK